MGLYDTFIGDADERGIRTAVQVKFTQLEDGLPSYSVGDVIPLDVEECVIIGLEGYVVIRNSIVQQVGLTIYDKWGGLYEPRDIIGDANPIAQVLKMTDLEQIDAEEILKQIEEEEEE